jgi:hypothetical protein
MRRIFPLTLVLIIVLAARRIAGNSHNSIIINLVLIGLNLSYFSLVEPFFPCYASSTPTPGMGAVEVIVNPRSDIPHRRFAVSEHEL